MNDPNSLQFPGPPPTEPPQQPQTPPQQPVYPTLGMPGGLGLKSIVYPPQQPQTPPPYQPQSQPVYPQQPPYQPQSQPIYPPQQPGPQQAQPLNPVQLQMAQMQLQAVFSRVPTAPDAVDKMPRLNPGKYILKLSAIKKVISQKTSGKMFLVSEWTVAHINWQPIDPQTGQPEVYVYSDGHTQPGNMVGQNVALTIDMSWQNVETQIKEMMEKLILPYVQGATLEDSFGAFNYVEANPQLISGLLFEVDCESTVTAKGKTIQKRHFRRPVPFGEVMSLIQSTNGSMSGLCLPEAVSMNDPSQPFARTPVQ